MWQTASAIFRIAHFVRLFEVIHAEHKHVPQEHHYYVLIVIKLPCLRVTRYCII